MLIRPRLIFSVYKWFVKTFFFSSIAYYKNLMQNHYLFLNCILNLSNNLYDKTTADFNTDHHHFFCCLH